MRVDWSSLEKVRQPTKRERGRYHAWTRYLKDSRLSHEEIHRRASAFAEQGRSPPKD